VPKHHNHYLESPSKIKSTSFREEASRYICIYSFYFLFLFEKCLVVHSHPTPIPLLSTWTNNVRDSGESVVGPIFFNNIIGPSRRRWDRSRMRVYNQAFLFLFSVLL